MTVDNTDSGATIATESTETTATSDSSSPASTTATSTDAAPVSAGTTDGAGPASAATQTEVVGKDPSTTPDTTLQNAKQAAPNWEQRYGDLRKREAELTRQLQQREAQMQQFRGVDPNAVRAWQMAQRRAQQENLPVWNPQNPNNARFQQTQAKWQAYKAAMGRAQTPEQREVIKSTLGAEFAPEEVRAVQEWENHQRQFQERMAADPYGAIATVFDQRIQQAIQSHIQRQQAEQTVGQWFQDKANADVIQRYGQQMMAALQQGNSWNMVRDYYANQVKLDSVQSRVGDASKAETAAKEKERLLQGQAAVTRDPKVDKRVDPMKVAKQRNIQPGTDEYWDLLHELKESGLI